MLTTRTEEDRILDRLRKRAARRGLAVAACRWGGWCLVDRQSRFVLICDPTYSGLDLDELAEAIDAYPLLTDPAWVPPWPPF